MNATTIQIPDASGTVQTVSTMDALLADGGQVTIGAKADAAQQDSTQTASLMAFIKGQLAALGKTTDAAATQTDTTAVSQTSIFKQISKSIQLFVFGAGTSAAAARVTLSSDDPGVTVLGAVADAAVSAGATGSLSAKLRSISRDLVANIVLAAGTNVIGKVTIDQTTPGTTDSVTVSTSQGAGAAIGATTDAAVSAGATGTISAKLRSISRDLVANIVLAAGANIIGQVSINQTTPGTTDSVTVATGQGAGATIGATSDAAVAAGATGSLSAKLRSISRDLVANIVLAAGEAHLGSIADAQYTIASMGNFTRPANTTPYASGQLVANSVTAGSVVLLTCATAARVSAGNGEICGARIQKSTNSVTNAAFRLHLFTTIPTVTTNGDGSAISGNIVASAKGYIGFIDITSMTGFSDVAWGTGAPDNSRQRIPYVATAQSIFGLIEARGAYTPGNAEVFTIDLQIHQN